VLPSVQLRHVFGLLNPATCGLWLMRRLIALPAFAAARQWNKRELNPRVHDKTSRAPARLSRRTSARSEVH